MISSFYTMVVAHPQIPGHCSHNSVLNFCVLSSHSQKEILGAQGWNHHWTLDFMNLIQKLHINSLQTDFITLLFNIFIKQ